MRCQGTEKMSWVKGGYGTEKMSSPSHELMWLLFAIGRVVKISVVQSYSLNFQDIDSGGIAQTDSESQAYCQHGLSHQMITSRSSQEK